MRIALIADIHGNSIAFDAVLADAVGHNPDTYLFLGDLVDGHDPSGVLERIRNLPKTLCIFGNTEQYIITGNGPPPYTLRDIPHHLDKLHQFQQGTASWAWSKGWLCATHWFDWVCQLPRETHITLPNGQLLLGVHAMPGYADGPGIGPHITDAELTTWLTGCTAAIVCVGHTHIPFIRMVNQVTVINPGAVSNPLAPDLRASYALLDADNLGWTVQHRRVEYDHAAVIAAVERSQHPAASFIIDHQVGNRTIDGMVAAANARRHMIN
jgi:predicted phosphodiesterase